MIKIFGLTLLTTLVLQQTHAGGNCSSTMSVNSSNGNVTIDYQKSGANETLVITRPQVSKPRFTAIELIHLRTQRGWMGNKTFEIPIQLDDQSLKGQHHPGQAFMHGDVLRVETWTVKNGPRTSKEFLFSIQNGSCGNFVEKK